MASETKTGGISGAGTNTLSPTVSSGKILRVPAGALWIENTDTSSVTVDLQVIISAAPCKISSITIAAGATWINSGTTATDFILSFGAAIQLVTTSGASINYYCGALEGDA